MQFRRGLIAFVLVLVGVTLIASISAPVEDDDSPAGERPRAVAPEAIEVAFRHPLEGAPPLRSVRGGSHVIVRASADAAGNIEISGLGLIEAVAPGTPAVFDILTSRVGRYDVTLVPVAGDRVKLGTLEVAR